jgi:hypothetical protein
MHFLHKAHKMNAKWGGHVCLYVCLPASFISENTEQILMKFDNKGSILIIMGENLILVHL